MKRLSKEYCLNINDNIDVKYGSVDKTNPSVIYVNCKSWICPEEQIDYVSAMSEVFNSFKKKLKSVIVKSPYFENKFICDFDIKAASIREKKKKYISFEFLVKQKGIVYSLKEIRNTVEDTFKTIIDNLVIDLKSHTFIVTKGK